MTTQKDRLYIAFTSMKKDLLVGSDAQAFKTLQRIVKSEIKRTKKKEEQS